jgi:hypothetical protein
MLNILKKFPLVWSQKYAFKFRLEYISKTDAIIISVLQKRTNGSDFILLHVAMQGSHFPWFDLLFFGSCFGDLIWDGLHSKEF